MIGCQEGVGCPSGYAGMIFYRTTFISRFCATSTVVSSRTALPAPGARRNLYQEGLATTVTDIANGGVSGVSGGLRPNTEDSLASYRRRRFAAPTRPPRNPIPDQAGGPPGARPRRETAARGRCRNGRAGGGPPTATRRIRRNAAAKGREQCVEVMRALEVGRR